jgi:hypothetical protein
MDQASMTVTQYMGAAIVSIDKLFDEEGYAKKHPELVGAMVQAAAIDFLAWSLDKPLLSVSDALNSIASEIGSRPTP